MKLKDSHKTYFYQYLNVCKSSFLLAGFFSFFINLLMLTPTVYMLQVYGRVVISGSLSTLLMITIIMIVLMVTMGCLEWVRSQILVHLGIRLDTLLSQKIFDTSFKQELYFPGHHNSKQPLADLTGLRQFLSGHSLFAFFDAPWVPIYIGIMFLFHPIFGWIAVSASCILLLLSILNEKLTQKDMSDANNISTTSDVFLEKNLRNTEVIEAMGMLSGIYKKWSRYNKSILCLQANASNKAGFISSLSRTIRLILQSLILGFGAYLAIRQQLAPELMIAGSILLGRALSPIDHVIAVWNSFITARGQYKRLNKLLSNIPENCELMKLPEPLGDLSVENLVVAPPGHRQPVIRGISFSVTAGDIIGIMGPSGSGKSSLARALIGIWPSLGGKVRLDGADIYNWNRQELGPHIGYLPQNIELFDGKICENIARFGELNTKEVIAAAKMAGVHEMILRLPYGYDTPIGDDGIVLSGGQRQRIGLARALYSSPKLIILDEPNSNLDSEGEHSLVTALQRIKQIGCTTFIISHRHSIFNSVNKLLVINEGRVSAFGDRDEVLGKLNQGKPLSPAIVLQHQQEAI